MTEPPSLAVYQKHRPTLFALAYRMLGSQQDAEDILQDAYLKFHQVPVDSLNSPRAYLITQVSRQCIDWLRKDNHREHYKGPWLPEPLIDDAIEQACPSELTHRYQLLSHGMIWMMEQLSPEQRAVLILREVLEQSYEEIGDIIGKTTANCRQIYRRAKDRMAKTPSEPDDTARTAHGSVVERLLNALTQADAPELIRLLDEDVTLWSDGGGKVSAISKPLHGREGILTFLAGLHHLYRDDKVTFEPARINGEAGILIRINGTMTTSCTVLQHNGHIEQLLMVRNPDKLKAP